MQRTQAITDANTVSPDVSPNGDSQLKSRLKTPSFKPTPILNTQSPTHPPRSQRLRAAVLGGCVVLTATVSVSTPTAWAAPVKATAKSTPVAKAAPKAAVKSDAKVTTARPQNAPQSRIAAKAAPVAVQAPSLSETVEPVKEVRASSQPRFAVAGAGADAGNTPAAAPTEEQPRLEVPINPDNDAPEEDPNLPEAPDADQSTPATPTVTTSPATPVPDLGTTGLAPADAEGREISSVRVVGNSVVSETTILLAASGIKPGMAYSSRQAEVDLRRVRELGFFAGVEQQVVPNLQDPTKVDVILVVIENRIVTAFRIEGNKEVPSSEILPVITSKTGAVLNSRTVDADVKAIQALYSQRGFAALVTDVKQEDNGTVIFTIQEGVISKIVFDGLKKTRPSIVRSIIAAKPGDPFNESRIQRDLNRIYDTGFFEDVTYKVSDDPETPGALIVTITVKEKRTGQFSVGLGFDSRSKVSGFAGISETNFRGTGKNVSAQVELGSQRSFDLGFGDRFVGSKNASYSFNVFNRRTFREPRTVEKVLGPGSGDDQTFNYQEERTGLRFNYTYPLDFERTKSFLIGYRNESVKLVLNDDDDGVPEDLPARSTGRISAPSFGFLRDKRDLRLDPSRGGRELFLIEQGLSLLGNSSFTKADLDIRRYIPLMGPQKRGDLPRLVLAGRMVFGQTLGQLPAFEQYFIGGSDTVRGHNADEQFGDNQFYGNIEMRFRFQRKLQFVAFADAGSAYGGEFSSSKAFEALFGIGVGVRLQTPIGPVRLDIAKGTGGSGRSDGIKTHFGIGSSF